MKDRELEELKERWGADHPLISTIEGLKGEVERLKSDVSFWHETWEQERDLSRGQKEQLRQQVEKYRTALKDASELIDRMSDQMLPHNPMYRIAQDFIKGLDIS